MLQKNYQLGFSSMWDVRVGWRRRAVETCRRLMGEGMIRCLLEQTD